ncbi:polysaccharide biosynthesis protein [Candidatus Thioglobus autotrophicus]|uniref:polysaccharide biosynthesis protein n=1 Tax=Candidatus Thioglobus autotrophicus TaxID=1705394 RepID=UPI00299F134E|nr:nucleoside-diphosphate sugar epimerase/dehydratase [Candidatus Thioglobus autotrophicus]WPE17685.1 nucleoside-diphosphate sugar epimerase/dehydratase [Candidatus Thioglobus autotrophicus]
MLFAPLVAIPIFIKFGLYRAIVRYIGFKALWVIVQAVSLYSLVWGVIVLLSGVQGVPRSVILINWILSMLLIGGSRIVGRWLFSNKKSHSENRFDKRKKILVYGAGSAGIQLATALTYSHELNPVAFIDDEITLVNHQIMGLKVYPSDNLGELVTLMKIKEVLLAIPSASRDRRNEIINNLESHPVLVRTVPGVSELAQGKLKIDDLNVVSINDLLGRDPVPPNQNYLRADIVNKVVMITGAGGSIGSELCRQIIKLQPNKIILFEQNEFALYSIDQELIEENSKIDIVPILGSVLDSKQVERVCSTFSVQTIYHAAAYKHVPMIELNNFPGIENNIFGTLSCAEAAVLSNVQTFVLISTDKAVRPTNIMGVTKRFSEMILQALSQKYNDKETNFSMVRFGNVLDSSGSVIPIFKKQIKGGGPVTVTDPEIIRYFMTIPEAAQLVIQAGAMSKGGDVFVLDMGQPVKILNLAKKMIHLSGLTVKDGDNSNGDIEILFTGLRPGEKLYEELLIGDSVLETEHHLILRANEEMLSWPDLKIILDKLKVSIDNQDLKSAHRALIEAVPGYKPQGDINDLMYLDS